MDFLTFNHIQFQPYFYLTLLGLKVAKQTDNRLQFYAYFVSFIMYRLSLILCKSKICY